MILPCTCKHDMQDKLHGVGRRVHTSAKDESWRCSVCDTERNAGKAATGNGKGKKKK